MQRSANRPAFVLVALILAACAGSAGENAEGTGGAAGSANGTGGGTTSSTGGTAGPSANGGSTAGNGGSGNPSAGGASSGGALSGSGAAIGAAGGPVGGAATGGGGGATGAGGTAPIASGGAAGSAATGDVIYAAPDGVDGAAGTITAPTTLTDAIERVKPGGTIDLRGGTYTYDVQVTIEESNSGTANGAKNLVAHTGEKPVLDFSSQPYGTGTNPRGLQINGDHWHVVGLDVRGSADNGIYVAGNDNVIESCVTHGNRDTGLQIGRASSTQTMPDWPANNLILDCESYDNYDSPPGAGENADGFAAKLTVGPGNVFRGCISHHNIDDGWDLYTKSDTGPIGSVTIDQCVAHHNGTLTDGTSNTKGDRNGFKLGGEKIAVSHTVTRSVSFANGKNGFTWNSNPGALRVFNCLAFDNVEGNFKFGDSSTSTAAVFANDVSFWTGTGSAQSDKTVGTDVSSSNAFWDSSKSQPSINGKGLVVTAADFAAALTGATVKRNADGSLDLSAFRLASGSDLTNAGVVPPGSLPFDAPSYYAGAPDLGAVEAR
jgi:hypothetical protein